jgi:hypothetical protein
MSSGVKAAPSSAAALAPLIATWLLSTFGGWWAVAAWIVVTSLAGIIGVALVRRLRPDEEADTPPITPRPRHTVVRTAGAVKDVGKPCAGELRAAPGGGDWKRSTSHRTSPRPCSGRQFQPDRLAAAAG